MPWRTAADSGSDAVGRFKAGRFRNGGNVHTLLKKKNKLSRMLMRYFVLTRALLGGGRLNAPPPSGFSRTGKKRRRCAPPGFHPPYPSFFPQLLWKFRPKAMWGQVTRSGQVTQLQNKFPIAPRLQCFRESYETFGIWWGHQCLQNVYLGFLISVTSGQVIFATSPL